MSNVLDKISTRVHDRRKRWSTFEVSELPVGVEEPSIIGSFSVCRLESRSRIIDLNKSIQIDGVIDTPSSLARDYLYSIYRRGPNARDKQIDNINSMIKSPPCVSRPCKFGDGIYIDITATYWSIMNCVGWNVDYNPPNWLGNGRPPLDFPWPDHKRARNCLVSAGALAPMVIHMPDSLPIAWPTDNRLKNKQLICLIGDVLNSLAGFAIRHGAVYANVDGYIFTDETTASNMMNEIQEWGLTARVRDRGEGYVSGPGLYQIGNHKPHRESYGDHWLYNIVEPDYAGWLKRAFSRIAYRYQNLIGTIVPGLS